MHRTGRQVDPDDRARVRVPDRVLTELAPSGDRHSPAGAHFPIPAVSPLIR